MQARVAIGIILLLIVAGGVLILNDRLLVPPRDASNQEKTFMQLLSSAFAHGKAIPSQYTCDAENISPPLSISDVPEGTKSLVLLMDDPDIPDAVKQSRGISVFDHWVVFNIPPDTELLEEGGVPPGIQGANDAGSSSYTGPCPPKEFEPREHRYFFTLYALDTTLGLSPGATKAEVEQAMDGHILAEKELVGRYERQ